MHDILLNRVQQQHAAFIGRLAKFAGMYHAEENRLFSQLLLNPEAVREMLKLGGKHDGISKQCLVEFCELLVATNEMFERPVLALMCQVGFGEVTHKNQLNEGICDVLLELAIAGYICVVEKGNEVTALATSIGAYLVLLALPIMIIDMEQIYQRMEELRGV